MNKDTEMLSVIRPAIRYYGGAWQRAKWTLSFFPPHRSYLEPCFGVGSILFNKPAVKLESINDIGGRMVTFFQVVRANPDDLIHRIRLTPWAEAEFKICLRPSKDKLEDARRFFFSCWASIKGEPNPSPADFRWQKKLTWRSLCRLRRVKPL